MRRVVLVAVGAFVGACGKAPAPAPTSQAPSAPTTSTTGWTCEQLPFATETPVHEASAAAWFEIDGKQQLVVISDSGNDGEYVVIDPGSGKTGELGKLPLGGSTDDIEGLAAHGDKLFGLTSPGWILVWKRAGNGFELVDGPYPIAPIGSDMICDKRGTNCGRNYEGLAIRPATSVGCAGFAASKTDGKLYCLSEDHDRYSVDPKRSIAIDRPKVVADCTYDEAGTLWVGDNLFGLSQVFRVTRDANPADARVEAVAQLGVGFPEVIAVRGDIIYRMSDTGGSPSLMAKFRCRPPAR